MRWWGSYFDDPNGLPGGPGIEDGYILSFFSDIPADPNDPDSFSKPGDLLGTYVAPLPVVKVDPTPYADWGNHEVWQYEVNLQDTHLFHPSPLAEPISFNEQAGDIYWLSIVAEHGAVLDPVSWELVHTDPATDPILQEHFWGWLTRPHVFNDVPTETKLFMPPNADGTGYDWLYPDWVPLQSLQHEPFADMTFQLLTVPEPSTFALAGTGLFGLLGFCWRRRRRN